MDEKMARYLCPDVEVFIGQGEMPTDELIEKIRFYTERYLKEYDDRWVVTIEPSKSWDVRLLCILNDFTVNSEYINMTEPLFCPVEVKGKMFAVRCYGYYCFKMGIER